MRTARLTCIALLCPTLLHGQLDGSLDPSFDPLAGANNDVYALAVQPDGRVIIGGAFTTFDVYPRIRIARLHADGSLDTGFDPGTGVYGGTSFPKVLSITVQPDGRILIGGEFTHVNGVARNNIARLNADGSLDTDFDPGMGASSWVKDIILLSDGRILAFGQFTSFNGYNRVRAVRLHPDGSVDTTFESGGIGPNNDVYEAAVQPDGRILIAGPFSSFGLTARRSLARLDANGSLDLSFDPGQSTGSSGFVTNLALQPDSMIIIGGTFTQYGGLARQRIARIHSDGTLDEGFAAQGGADAPVIDVELQPDGRVLIGGGFYNYNGTVRRFIARLRDDGTVDEEFDPGTGAYGDVYVICPAPEGKVYIGGRFTSYNGTPRVRVARLHSSIVSVPEHNGPRGPFLFPNPAVETVSVRLPPLADRWSIVFRDALGRVVRTEQVNGSSATVRCPEATGLYSISFISGATVLSAALVVER